MKRFFLPPEPNRGDRLVLEGREAHHAIDVLRLAPGEVVMVLDGAGGEVIATAGEITRHQVILHAESRRQHPAPAGQCTLLLALLKSKAMDWALQKATELGAYRIQPLETERSVAQVTGESAALKVAKWQAVAVEALKQCGLPWLPQIAAPQSLAAALPAASTAELSLVAALLPGLPTLGQALADYQARQAGLPRSVSVWIGPEGDFAPHELESLRQAGVQAVTLGPRVLRAETAALYCLAALQYEWLGRRPASPDHLA